MSFCNHGPSIMSRSFFLKKQKIFFPTWIRINYIFKFWFRIGKLLKSFHPIGQHDKYKISIAYFTHIYCTHLFKMSTLYYKVGALLKVGALSKSRHPMKKKAHYWKVSAFLKSRRPMKKSAPYEKVGVLMKKSASYEKVGILWKSWRPIQRDISKTLKAKSV